ncbi:hypothetical protein C346_00973 [Cryptococcus neoformans D17-1]|nr:hypothetical protein C346_00973 [Cryptococcus neoformans var. grubii D17-1]
MEGVNRPSSWNKKTQIMFVPR